MSKDSVSVADSIGVLSVAIGSAYVEYWKQMAASLSRSIEDEYPVVFHVFTDRPNLVRLIAEDIPSHTVRIYQVASLGWPDATLLRYQFFNDHIDAIRENFLLYLDADMEIQHSFRAKINTLWKKDRLSLVQHPGYYRPRGLERLWLYLGHPVLAVRDAFELVKVGGIGAWERNPASRAFVERRLRNRYVCGGCWMGPRQEIAGMIEDLAAATRQDQLDNFTAKWHDESHLNAYFATHGAELLGPEWCYADGYRNLARITPIVRAVEKGENRNRE